MKFLKFVQFCSNHCQVSKCALYTYLNSAQCADELAECDVTAVRGLKGTGNVWDQYRQVTVDVAGIRSAVTASA